MLRRLIDLPLLHFRIFLFAATVPLILRLPLPRVEQLLRPRRRRSQRAAVNADEVVRCVDRVLASTNRLLRPGCLTRGVTLYYFLRRAGIDVSLSFGIGDIDGRFAGHCWLVKSGEPFLERNDPTHAFASFYTLR